MGHSKYVVEHWWCDLCKKESDRFKMSWYSYKGDHYDMCWECREKLNLPDKSCKHKFRYYHYAKNYKEVKLCTDCWINLQKQ